MDKGQLFLLCGIGHETLDTVDVKRMEVAATKCHEGDDNALAWDDVTGAPLKPELVREARRAEMVYFEKLKCIIASFHGRCSPCAQHIQEEDENMCVRLIALENKLTNGARASVIN